MTLDPILNDSPLIAALKGGGEFRRTLVTLGQRTRNAADDLCDSADHLCALANQCFWASMHLEEGRSIRGTICICAPDDAPRARAFSEPVVCSAKSLVTLLTAFPSTPLAVQARGPRLEVWGVLDSIPMLAMRLRVAGTAMVIATDGHDVIAVLERGEVHIPKSASDLSWIVMVANALEKAKTFPQRLAIATRIQRAVLAMHRQGHGGALVIVPAGSDSWAKWVSPGFRFDPTASMAVQGLLGELDTAEKRFEELKSGTTPEIPQSMLPLFAESVAAHQDLINSMLRSIGDLSAVDGAVVMDEDLRVLGFGAKLDGSAGSFDVLVLDALSGESATASNSELGGTRHQSAARFVLQNPETMVFVASQDGRLTLFVWVVDPGKVAAIRRLEHFVWEC